VVRSVVLNQTTVVINRTTVVRTWLIAGLRVAIYRTGVVVYGVLCRTSVVLCVVIWRLRGYQLDCFCATYLELPSVTGTFEIEDQSKL